MHNQENISNWEGITEEAGYCIVLLLPQYWLVLINIFNLELKHCKASNSYGESDGDWHL